MSITVLDYINKAKYVRDNILDEQERIVYKNENEIVDLNINQILNQQGSDGRLLQNKNKIFTGRYTLSTQLFDSTKVAGTLYNYFVTGNFLGNFQIEIQSDLTKADIFSTGTGSGDKAEFFRGYENLFGLVANNQYKVNYEIIKPELDKFIKQYL